MIKRNKIQMFTFYNLQKMKGCFWHVLFTPFMHISLIIIGQPDSFYSCYI